jgi:hypothetical protein
MNILEGARRIQYVGRVALAIAAAVFAFSLIATLIGYFTSSSGFLGVAILPILIVLCLYPTIFGTIFLVIGWIVEGFATPPKTESSGD